jgi:pimeloyl-ACP methyl ester carboxylesterase
VRTLLAALAAAAAALFPAHRPALHACAVDGVQARCGHVVVPVDYARRHGPTIALRVVVIPAREKPVRGDAFTYLAGGPGGAATDFAADAAAIWRGINLHRDILLVDQRGTGGSHPLECSGPLLPATTTRKALRPYVASCLRKLRADPLEYGTMAAADDLEAVRRALGYRTLDLYGSSYGATLAQAFLIRHPRSVRTIVLDGGTLVSIPFYSRFATNGQRALDAVVARCHDSPRCGPADPGLLAQLARLIRAWNSSPVSLSGDSRFTGDDLAGVVQGLTMSAEGAAEVPDLIGRAAAGDLLAVDEQVIGPDRVTPSLMFWSIMCNEPWVGLDSHWAGPSYLTGFTRQALSTARRVCSLLPAGHETKAEWKLPATSGVPVLALVGGADPQDPLGNLTGLHRHFRHATIVVAHGMAHTVGQYGCLGALVSGFVDRGGGKVEASCVRDIHPTPFPEES